MLVFGSTILVGAFLLFLVQPLLGKFLLPWFGGSPSVWTTCMLFFQVLLLGGYVYAHRLASRLSLRRQSLVHATLLAASLLALPILPADSRKPSGDGSPVWEILAILAGSIGPAYFMLSTTGPLMQAWFGRTREHSPYRLYALSNLGSLLALAAFPSVIEPTMTIRHQAAVWMIGYVAFVILGALCAAAVYRHSTPESLPAVAVEPSAPPALGDRLTWLGLSACGSVMLLASTNQMCQDVAVIPLLWVLPLGIYLLSFILCFQNERLYPRSLFGVALICVLPWMAYVIHRSVWLDIGHQIAAYSVTLFVCCMVCHGELFRTRPPTGHLTLFYGMVAAGGALGGAVVTLVAPRLFKGFWEYQVGLVATGALFLLVLYRDRRSRLAGGKPFIVWLTLALGLTVYGGVLLSQIREGLHDSIEVSRNFFGVLRVLEEDRADPDQHRLTLMHGRIEHGFQFTSETKRYWPTSYFGPDSGVGLAIRFHPHRLDRAVRNLRIGVIGLGTGTLATYGEAGDVVRFYELNPEVLRMARKHFTYLESSSARVEVELGDGRISLEKEKERGESQRFDVLAVDAFSSDAIPVHLLTRESLGVYLYHLREDGILAFNISNRYLNLHPVVRGLATAAGKADMSATWIQGVGNPVQETDDSDWVLLTRNTAFFETPDVKVNVRKWSPFELSPVVWTDNFSNLIRLIRRKR